MIIASYGILEFIYSQECIDIIKDYYDKNYLKGFVNICIKKVPKDWLRKKKS